MNSRLSTLSVGLALWLGAALWAGAAHADKVQIKVGEEIVLATYYEIRPENCMALRAPSVLITHEPIIGSATVLRTQGQATTPSRCRNVAVPIAQVLYRAKQPGTDLLVWEVSYQAKSKSIEQGRATITVMPAP